MLKSADNLSTMFAKTQNYTFANLISDIRYEKIHHSYSIAMRSMEIVKHIINNDNWETAQELINILKEHLKHLCETLPLATIPANVLRHILKMIREIHTTTYNAEKQQHGQRINDLQQSLHHLVTGHSGEIASDYTEKLSSLRSNLRDHLGEYKLELETAISNIAEQASEHINSNEIILTFGTSNLVCSFLKNAAKTSKFQVIAVESTPTFEHEQSLALDLSACKIQTTVIPNSAVFAIMSRVNKVIIGVHSIMANGGLRAVRGVQSVALAAKECSVPVIVLSHLYKLTPQFVCSYEQDAFNACASPAHVLPYSTGPVLDVVDIYNPVFDYVPPELVTLFITHQGGNATSYVYRLLSELYHPDDYEV